MAAFSFRYIKNPSQVYNWIIANGALVRRFWFRSKGNVNTTNAARTTKN
jgi:hypothetical protein